MSYTLLALTMEYKIGDTIMTEVVTTSTEFKSLDRVKQIISQEAVNLRVELKKKLVVLTGRYHNMLYGTVGLSHSHNFEQTPSNYYKELQSIEAMLITKYDTIAKYFKSKDISKICKVTSFKIIEIRESKGVY